jgi:N-acylneuraminate cytidylyltransferase
MRKNRIAIIPARGGSNRIPRKNIKDFLGKPIIAYAIEEAIKSNLFDEVMVSTDDVEISEVAQKYGAMVPFFRSAETSNDTAGLIDVLYEVQNTYRIRENVQFKECCCILPTSPLLQASDLLKSSTDFAKGKFDTLLSVVKYGYPIQRSLKIVSGRVVMNWPEYYSARTQDLDSNYHDAGMFYWLRFDDAICIDRLFTENSGGYEIPEHRVQDIDTESDWKLAEIKYSFLLS